ncbi:MAG: hypothetical protein V7L23_25550 [Nostoc sp.]|uniref:hypothetical protein n=1 Tax=Nostoc sp. TaxID=1180 RepID=UPI002FEFCE4A
MAFGVSAGVGTSALATTAAVGWTRQTNTDPMIGVLIGSVSAIALCAIVSAWFLFKEKNE